MRALWFRLQWWFWGEVAELIEEYYDGAGDAIGFPLLSWTIGVIFWGFVGFTPGAPLVARAIAFGLGLASVVLASIATAATIVYFRHRPTPEQIERRVV